MTYEIDGELWAEIVQLNGMRETFADLEQSGWLSREPTQSELARVPQAIRRKMEAGAWGDTTDEYVAALIEVAPEIRYMPEV